MLRRSLAAGLLVGIFISAGAVLAKQGFVRTKDNRVIEGDITEKDDNVIVKVRGVDVILPKADVVEVVYPENITQEFKDRLGKLDAKDFEGRMRLARWAFDRKRYDLAREAAYSAQAADPNNKEVAEFIESIQSQVVLERRVADTPAAADTPAKPPATSPADVGDRRLLSASDINRIRQKEMTNADENIRVRFDKEVRRRYAQRMGENTATFNALSPQEQASRILATNDPRLTDDVRIVGEPQSLLEFRRMHPQILAGCAAAGCHGAPGVGNFMLFAPGESDPVLYTNFYILQRYAKKVKDNNAKFGTDVERRMIDRTQPALSLLAEYGLPPAFAETPHPPLLNYKGIYRNREDPRFQRVLDWMGKSLNPVDPEYGIDYKIPGATTQPSAAAPAPAPATQPGRATR